MLREISVRENEMHLRFAPPATLPAMADRDEAIQRVRGAVGAVKAIQGK